MGTVRFCSFCTQHEIARFSLLPPSLPLSLNPRQRLIPTTAMVLATGMVLATATVLATDATTMARGRLRLPPRLRLILTFTATAAMGLDTDTEDTTVDTVLATTESVR